MGFFSRFKKEENYTLQQAMDLIAKRLAEAEGEHREKYKKTAVDVAKEMDVLADLVKTFEESHALNNHKGAEQIKNRFCSVTNNQLKVLNSESDNYLDDVRATLNGIGGLTQKQIMYIKVFFEESFQPVLKKVRSIESLLEKAKDETTDYRKAVRFYKKIRDLEEEKGKIQAERIVNEEKIEDLKLRLSQISSIEPGQVDETILAEARRKASSLRQEIDSFLSLQKLYKKYLHDSDTKEPLLEEYIKSPSNALLQDSEIRIVDLTKQAAQALEGQVDEMKKKIETVVGGSIYLRVVRDDLADALNILGTEHEKFKKQNESLEAKKMAKDLEIQDLESQIKKSGKIMDESQEKFNDYNSEISKTRTDLCLLASKLVGGNVA